MRDDASYMLVVWCPYGLTAVYEFDHPRYRDGGASARREAQRILLAHDGLVERAAITMAGRPISRD